MVQMLEERPPYVMFETRAEEDRDASQKAGHYVGRDVDYVFVTPHGSKDRIERVAADWIAKLEDDALQERIPKEWLRHFKGLFEDFKGGREGRVNGIPVQNWPGLSPSQVKTCQSLKLFAVEDVAAMNEEAIARMGMGARALKQRAQEYLAAAKDVGQVAEASASLKLENEGLKAQVAQLTDSLKLLSAQMELLQKAGAANLGAAAPTPPSDDISLDDVLGSKL